MRRVRFSRLFVVLVLLLAMSSAYAQDGYPSRTIRIIVPYSPGAITDSVSRAFAVELGKALNQAVIVENKPGAGTVVGTQTAKQAPADGYSILFASTSLLSSIIGLSDPGYKIDDFVPIAMLGNIHYVLMIPSVLSARTVREFVDYAKTNSGKLNYAVIGVGGSGHVLSERFKKIGAFDWEGIPYKGGVPIFQALMANEVQAYFSTQNGAITQRDSGKMRLLATAADERSEFLPDIPTFRELGYEGMTERNWSALFVHSQTPKDVVEKLRRVSAQIMASDVMKDHLRKLGISVYSGTIDQFAASMPEELKQRAGEMKRLGIQPQ